MSSEQEIVGYRFELLCEENDDGWQTTLDDKDPADTWETYDGFRVRKVSPVVVGNEKETIEGEVVGETTLAEQQALSKEYTNADPLTLVNAPGNYAIVRVDDVE